MADYPYVTRLDILRGPLELVDVGALATACEHKWFNQTLCQVDSAVVRVGIVEGEYHWHHHDEEDEFFYVLTGHLSIDLEDRTIELAPNQGVVIPKKVRHRPRAAERTVMLMVEKASVVPTGS